MKLYYKCNTFIIYIQILFSHNYESDDILPICILFKESRYDKIYIIQGRKTVDCDRYIDKGTLVYVY